MSMPIKACWVAAAAKGDESKFEAVLERMKLNSKYGSMTVYPCDCETKCTATDEELEAFDKRIAIALKGDD